MVDGIIPPDDVAKLVIESRQPVDYLLTSRRESMPAFELPMPKIGSRVELSVPTGLGGVKSGVGSITAKWNARHSLRLATVRFQ